MDATRLKVLTALFAATLTACGGGGGTASSGPTPASASRWMTITSRRLMRATTARATAASQRSTSPSRMNVPRSSETATSTPPAVFLRKRFFCASQWSSSSGSMDGGAARARLDVCPPAHRRLDHFKRID